MIHRTAQTSIIGISMMFALAGCSLPLVSEQEMAIQAGEQFEKMSEELTTSEDPDVRRYVLCVANAIVATLKPPYSELKWDIEIFADDVVNAFAMPGGKIGVYTGLLNVAENQDQLGAVLGHEVAHVTEQHSLERMNRTLTTQGIAALGSVAIGGGVAGEVVQGVAQYGILLPYGRGQESEADIVGLGYMADAGFDPSQSVQLWRNMAANNEGAPPEFMSTHPSSDTRIDDLANQLPVNIIRFNNALAAGKRPDCGP